MTPRPDWYPPLVGAQLSPVTGLPEANRQEERLIARGARWWMQQARRAGEAAAAKTLETKPHEN